MDGQGPTRQGGRPPIVVIEEVLEQRRLSKQQDEKMVVNIWEDSAYQFRASLVKARDVAIFVVVTGLLAKKILWVYSDFEQTSQ